MKTGDIIKALRIENGMTQEELAEQLGLQKSAIAKYEKPSADVLNNFDQHDREEVLKNDIKVINMAYINSHAKEFQYFSTDINDYYIVKGTATNIDYEYNDDSESSQIKYSITVDDSKYTVVLFADADEKISLVKGNKYYFMSVIYRLNYDTSKEADLTVLALRYYNE